MDMEVGVNVTATGGSGSLGPSFVGLELLDQLKPLFLPLYAVLVVVACVGNSLLVLLISTTKKLHSTTNFLIGNLAASDLIMCLFCVPLTVSYAFERRGWLFGAFMCYFVTLMQAAAVFVSVLSLTAIAVDRYVVVIYPVHRRIQPRSCAYMVALIWLLSLCISVPSSLHTRYVDLNRTGHDMIVCEEFWTNLEKQRLLYSCSVLLLFYMLPLCAVSISYWAIGRHLRKRRVPGAAVCGQERWSSRKRKTFRRLTISILAFALCWMPLQTINLIRDIDQDFTIMGKRYMNVIQICCHLVAMSSTCYNPFIYASLHHKLRLRLGGPLHRGKSQANSTNSSRTSRLHLTSPMVLAHKLVQIDMELPSQPREETAN